MKGRPIPHVSFMAGEPSFILHPVRRGTLGTSIRVRQLPGSRKSPWSTGLVGSQGTALGPIASPAPIPPQPRKFGRGDPIARDSEGLEKPGRACDNAELSGEPTKAW